MALFQSLHKDADVPVEYVPVYLAQDKLIESLPVDDADAIYRILQLMIAASRHKRVLTAQDTPATAVQERVRYTVEPKTDPASNGGLEPHYVLQVAYPSTLDIEADDWFKIVAMDPLHVDRAKSRGPTYDKPRDQMVLTLHLWARAARIVPKLREIIHIVEQPQHIYLPASSSHVPLGGIPLRRENSVGGSPVSSPLVIKLKKKRAHDRELQNAPRHKKAKTIVTPPTLVEEQGEMNSEDASVISM